MNIGVFDSGVGGQSVATALGVALPECDIIFLNDYANVPYGSKSESELFDLTLPKIEALAEQGCEIIVIACNSVSTTILPRLQKQIRVPLIGVEPMIEQACEMTKSGVIAVCATPTTLASQRYIDLCHHFATNKVVIEPDCSQWASMIENETIDRLKIELTVNDVLEQGADVIVLGCTHYHWIQSLITYVCGEKASVIQPEEWVIDQVKQELAQRS